MSEAELSLSDRIGRIHEVGAELSFFLQQAYNAQAMLVLHTTVSYSPVDKLESSNLLSLSRNMREDTPPIRKSLLHSTHLTLCFEQDYRVSRVLCLDAYILSIDKCTQHLPLDPFRLRKWKQWSY